MYYQRHLSRQLLHVQMSLILRVQQVLCSQAILAISLTAKERYVAKKIMHQVERLSNPLNPKRPARVRFAMCNITEK